MTSCREIKKQIAFVGDSQCGKTSLAVRLSYDMFLDYYHPTQLVDDYSTEVDTGKYNYTLTLLDLSGSCENDSIRSLVYEKCDLVVVCFDLTDSASLDSVTRKWLPELEKQCPRVPFILAGCKQDEVSRKACVDVSTQLETQRDHVKGLLSKGRARAYVECSSKFMEGVDELTHLIVDMVQKKRTAARKFASSINLFRKFI